MNLEVEPAFRPGILEIIDSLVTAYLCSGALNIGYCLEL